MRKLFVVILTICIFASMFCVGASAATAPASGDASEISFGLGFVNTSLNTNKLDTTGSHKVASIFGEGSVTMLIIIIVIAVVAAVIGVVVFANKKKKDHSDSKENDDEE